MPCRSLVVVVAVSAPILASGCGGAASDADTGGTGGAGGSGALSGSYDVVLSGVRQQDPNNPGIASPSEGVRLRLDLRRQGEGYQAVVTPRFGQASALAVTLSRSAMTLSGAVVVAGGAGATDTWATLTLQRAASGRLSGALSALGTEELLMGDVVSSGAVEADGNLTPDATAPELQVRLTSSVGPGDALLPWDPLVVVAAEGVQPAAWESRLGVVPLGDAQGLPELGWELTPEPASPSAWAGALAAEGRWRRWSDGGVSFSVEVAAGTPDLAGHAAAALVAPAQLLWVGPPQPRIDYGADAIDYGQWGRVRWLAPGDAACEPGASCAKIGSFESGACGAGSPAGLAARLQRSGDVLHVRYRVEITLPDEGDPQPAPTWAPSPLGLELAVPGGRPRRTSVALESGAFTSWRVEGAARIWTTGWRTFDVPLAEEQSAEIGYALFAGLGPGTCTGGLIPPPVTTTVYVTSVTVD